MVRENEVIFRSSIKDFKDIKINEDNNALVYITANNSIDDINGKTTYDTDMVLSLQRDKNNWIVENVIFKKGSGNK